VHDERFGETQRQLPGIRGQHSQPQSGPALHELAIWSRSDGKIDLVIEHVVCGEVVLVVEAAACDELVG
jgi:hypothetical protein